MFIGNIAKINLSTSFFEEIIRGGYLYIDKTRFIEHFLNAPSSVQLIARQRRLGKSLNMDMLRCFLTDKKDYRGLFDELYIRSSPVWEMAHSAPVFLFDFNGLTVEHYDELTQFMINAYALDYVNAPNCPAALRENYTKWSQNDKLSYSGIRLLTEIVYAVTGKKSYILIDEYDKLLMDNLHSDSYSDIHHFMTSLLSFTLKGNPYLAQALITGVTRISYEGMLSGLNNITVYDVFRDQLYTDDYGFTESEVGELSAAAGFDIVQARDWYNGIKINGHAIYNTFGIMNMISHKSVGYYWTSSGTMELIASLMSAYQKRTIINLMENRAKVRVEIEEKISPAQLRKNCEDRMFFSLLVQSGYLSLEDFDNTEATVAIPNIELKEAWRRFILSNFFESSGKLRDLFVNLNTPGALAEDMQAYFSKMLDALSYYDLPTTMYPDGKRRVLEKHYHLLLYAILFSGKGMFGFTTLTSNRESGDGRYDLRLDFPEQIVIIEIKSAAEDENLEAVANMALKQITEMRYGADEQKPVTGIGCAFCKKRCRAVGRSL